MDGASDEQRAWAGVGGVSLDQSDVGKRKNQMMEAKAGAGQHRYACNLAFVRARVCRRTIKQAWRRALTCGRGEDGYALAVGDGGLG